jgi:hypothetical protein
MDAKPSIAYLGSAGVITAPARFDDETLLTALGANAGNLMFQYASPLLIDGPARHIGLADIPYGDPHALRGARCLIFPAANHLRLGADWTGLCAFIEAAQLPLVVLGLGAQAGCDNRHEMRQALRADPNLRRFAAVIRERATGLSFRGAYSAEVGADLGLEGAVLGCPSWLINPKPDLGAEIEAALRAIESGPIGLAAAAPFELSGNDTRLSLERGLITLLAQYGGLYTQQSGGVVALRAARDGAGALPENHRASLEALLWPNHGAALWDLMERSGYFPLSAPDWITRLRSLSLIIGSRLHGVMAGLAAARPAALIAHDSRTEETITTMHLPHIHADRVMAAQNLAGLAADVQFDGTAFDQARQSTAAMMVTLLQNAGLSASAHLCALAQPVDQVRRYA